MRSRRVVPRFAREGCARRHACCFSALKSRSIEVGVRALCSAAGNNSWMMVSPWPNAALRCVNSERHASCVDFL